MRLEVLQREYGFALRSNGTQIISTPRVETCVVWCGLDIKNGVAFLCHFDFSFSTRTLPKILKELALLVPPNHKFKSFLLGGRPLSWSSGTRECVVAFLSQQSELTIELEEGPYFKGLRGKGIFIDLESGESGQCSSSPIYRNSLKDKLIHNWHILSSLEMKRAIGSA